MAFSQGIQATCFRLSLCYHLVKRPIFSLYHWVYILFGPVVLGQTDVDEDLPNSSWVLWGRSGWSSNVGRTSVDIPMYQIKLQDASCPHIYQTTMPLHTARKHSRPNPNPWSWFHSMQSTHLGLLLDILTETTSSLDF